MRAVKMFDFHRLFISCCAAPFLLCVSFYAIANNVSDERQHVGLASSHSPTSVIPQPKAASPRAAAASEKEKSPSLLSGYENVISALLGALLTFVITQYSERQNWTRKKAEQVRDRQLSKLSDAARALDMASAVISLSTRNLEKIVGAGGTKLRMTSLQEAELQATGRQASHDVSGALAAIRLCAIDLRICRIKGAALTLLDAAHQQLCNSKSFFESVELADTTPDISVLCGFAREVESISSKFADTALDSLHD
jgi:hypothetical protein